MQDKLEVLYQVAKELNKNNISWAIGASVLLYLKGIVLEFNDLDIVLEVKDVEKTKTIFKDLNATLYPSKDNSGYKTTCFLEYNLNGVDIDLMAGFKIELDGVVHDCSFKASDVKEYAKIKDVDIPLDDLNNWERYYLLMKRLNKVALIQNYFHK